MRISVIAIPVALTLVPAAPAVGQTESCGIWLAPSPIKEQEDHGWGHSMFTGKLIPKGTFVSGSGIMDETKREKVTGDLFVPVYDWEALDMGVEGDPPLFQELWNGDIYDDLALESYEGMRVFMPGLSNIPPCTSSGFNLEQVRGQITYRDWRGDTSNGAYRDGPSPQAGSFSYLSHTLFRAARDIQPGEELIVECSDNSDQFDPEDYPPVHFQPREAGGYAICLDDKAEERMADHTPNVAGSGQRGLFAKRKLNDGEIITSTPMTPVHREEMTMDREKYEEWEDQTEEETPTKRQQLLLNYMFGHPDSSLLWLPQAPLILAANHAAYNQKPSVEPNAKVRWHSDKYTEAQAAGKPLSRRQQFHHAELLEMDSLEVVQMQGMGLMIDLVATRAIDEGEEILIDYGQAWDDAMKKHTIRWNSTVETIRIGHERDDAMRKRQRKLESKVRELKQRRTENSMTASPPSSYVTAAEYNEQHQNDDIRTVTEQRRNPYPPNLETACRFEEDWMDEEDSEDGDADAVTYESWYNQDARLDYGCLLPCVIMERRDFVPGEENKHDSDDSDDSDDENGSHESHESQKSRTGSVGAMESYGGSASPKRYTAKLIDTHEANTSIGFQCHIYKRFEYIYMDIPRESIVFVNKPHSSDTWIDLAFRQPIGLPEDMVPNNWRDLNRRRGMRGGRPNVAGKAKLVAEKEGEGDSDKHYQLSIMRWNDATNRRERLKSLETKLGLSVREDL